MNPSKAEIDEALVNVRKAFRLIHDYQRAALDTVKYISAQLGFTYHDGYPRFSDAAPRHGKKAFDCWAWDWLNLVHFDFNFYQSTETDQQLWLLITLFSDSGFYVSENEEAEKTNVATFAPAETSKTKVGFILYWHWKDEWDPLLIQKDLVRRFLENDGELPQEIRNSGAFGKCFDFASLTGETSTELVIAELIRAGRACNFPLARIKKTN